MRIRNMGVHLGETGYQVTIRAVDDLGVLGHRHALDVTDGRNDAILDNDGLPAADGLGRHRNDVDIHECGRGQRGCIRCE